MAIECWNPSCRSPLPVYSGRGRPRRWCSTQCRRRAEGMAPSHRRGLLEDLAEQWRRLGRPDLADEIEKWRRLFFRLDNERTP